MLKVNDIQAIFLPRMSCECGKNYTYMTSRSLTAKIGATGSRKNRKIRFYETQVLVRREALEIEQHPFNTGDGLHNSQVSRAAPTDNQRTRASRQDTND